ncbi:MAG: hypothetical protein ABII26_04140 [Pseudomonadota bacterium]
MKKYIVIIISGMALLAIIGVGFNHSGMLSNAEACGWGKSGGGDYVPQRRGLSGSFTNRAALTKEQAYDIVANHIRKLNPDLKIGQFKDAGSFYEAEIMASGGEVVQVLGVDKESGRIILMG